MDLKRGPFREVHYTSREEWRAFLATPSANEFSDRGRWEKEIVTNSEEITWISSTIPMISLDWILPVIALKSVELSERTLRFKNSKVSAMQRADHTARVSAIHGEFTKVWIDDPWDETARDGPENIQPKPRLFYKWSMVSLDLDDRFEEERRAEGNNLISDVFPCASGHSFANLRPFNAISSWLKVLPSKINEFRAVQIA